MPLLCNTEIALLVKNESDFHFFCSPGLCLPSVASGTCTRVWSLLPSLPLGVSWHLSTWGLQYCSPHPGLRQAPKWLCYLPFLPCVNLCTNKQSDNLGTFSTPAGTELLEKKRFAKPGHTVCFTLLKTAQARLTSGTSMSCWSPFVFAPTGPQQLFSYLNWGSTRAPSSPSGGEDTGCSFQSSCGLLKAFKSSFYSLRSEVKKPKKSCTVNISVTGQPTIFISYLRSPCLSYLCLGNRSPVPAPLIAWGLSQCKATPARKWTRPFPYDSQHFQNASTFCCPI